jgi:methylenetetrahydrofolate reductase (NADPH)
VIAVRSRRRIDDRSRGALTAAVTNAAFEVLPLVSVRQGAAALPAGATVTVTASPSKPLVTTLELAAWLGGEGFRPVPHLAARMVRDRAHLRELLMRIRDAGIDDVFVVGGDASEPGEFADGLSLLRTMAELDHGLSDVGVPCYPDGHAFIPEARLLEALQAKAPFATYATTQLCFDARRIARWLRERRADGLELPVVLGVPGAVEPHRLLTIAARIGVRDTRRFVAKNLGLVGRLLMSGGSLRPDRLLVELADTIADPTLGVLGLHLYTFNQVRATVAWREDFLARLNQGA